MKYLHAPHTNEWLGFLAQFRGLACSTPNIPAITSMLTLPFLVRLIVDDSEPTLHLDLAPSLNSLTRRCVLAAIRSNTVSIEQIHIATLLVEGSSSGYLDAGSDSGSSLPTSPTQLTEVNWSVWQSPHMSPPTIQYEETRYQSTVISKSPTTPTSHSHSIQNSSTSPSLQRTGSGSGWAASKYLKSVTLSTLGGVVAGANGSCSNSPTPRHSVDSTKPNGSGPVIPTAATLERSPSLPPALLQTSIHAFHILLSNKYTTGSMSNSRASAIDSSQPS